jgi:hypothetical protein
MPVAYPTDLRLPLRASKSRSQPAAFNYDRPRRGTGYARPIGSNVPVFWTLTWRLTEAEAVTFLRWFTHDLDRGGLEFALPVRTEFGLSDYTCLFLPDDLMTAREEGALWVYTATVMARELVVPEAGPPPDPFFDDVLLLLMGEGANGSTTFTDGSNYARSVSIGGGSPTISTAQFKHGSASIYGGTSNSAQLLYSRAGSEWTQDNWSWDTWVRRAANANYLGLMYHTANLYIKVGSPAIDSLSYRARVYLNGTTFLTAASSVPLNEWMHLALSVSKSGLTYTVRLFVDGELEASTTSTNTNLSLISNASNASIGRSNSSGFPGLNAYLDGYRITAATRWTSDFTPPQLAGEYLP